MSRNTRTFGHRLSSALSSARWRFFRPLDPRSSHLCSPGRRPRGEGLQGLTHIWICRQELPRARIVPSRHVIHEVDPASRVRAGVLERRFHSAGPAVADGPVGRVVLNLDVVAGIDQCSGIALAVRVEPLRIGVADAAAELSMPTATQTHSYVLGRSRVQQVDWRCRTFENRRVSDCMRISLPTAPAPASLRSMCSSRFPSFELIVHTVGGAGRE